MRKTLALALFLAPQSLGAATFPLLGARAAAMGGAAVAAGRGPTASFWNPAIMARQPPGGSVLYGQGTADPEDLASRLDDLAATRALQPDILTRVPDAERAVDLLGAIASEPDPITGERPAGLFYGGGLYGLSLYRLTYARATPLVDRTHIEISDDPATGLPYNRSQLVLDSLQTNDYVFTLAFDFGDPTIVVGANARYSQGKAYFSARSLFAFPDFQASDVFGAAQEGIEETSSAWSFDVGALVTPTSGLSLGVIGKYLGEPEFATTPGSTISIPSRWRVGAAITPSAALTLAADLDINSSAVTSLGVEERDYAFGGEYIVGVANQFAIRAGYRDSVSGPSSQVITGGLGFRSKGFGIDGSIGWSPTTKATVWAIELAFAKSGQAQ